MKCLPEATKLGKDDDSTPVHHAAFQTLGWTKIAPNPHPALTSLGFCSSNPQGQCWLY